MKNDSTPRDMGLRHWAETTCEQAAVELLISFNGGHLLDGPWVRRTDAGSCWFDPEVAAAECGHLSGGQRRVLQVAMSLVSSKHPVDLGDVMTGIDPKAFVLVAQAIGQAYGLSPSFHDMSATHDATKPTHCKEK
ncbi:hypothetical protein FM113_07595 [Leucobacter sp. 7(1)]|uniref:hypothetical protein n=1 Tax=Leucobacter sp. 7(1) TaxID=1255613 RepID=UPI00097EDAE2|nr:hypothetical protein [Leucobacter sp. 7(1)]SJN09906.1 hypothetical protein FM113_07595 [Leucobacter sp. 7(1)]